MKTSLRSHAALLASAILLAPFAAQAAAPSKAEYTSAKTAISATFKSDKAACSSLKANPKDICVEEAKAKEKNDLAQLEYGYTGKAADGTKMRVAKADGTYNVAKERCDDMTGNDKDVCVKQAKSVHVAALADAKVAKATADARSDATEEKRAAQLKVETEKCDAQTGDSKASCIQAAKAASGKP